LIHFYKRDGSYGLGAKASSLSSVSTTSSPVTWPSESCTGATFYTFRLPNFSVIYEKF